MYKIALITGCSGQDGSYLSEFLISKGYIVHGLIRRTSSSGISRLKKVINHNNFYLHYGDLTDANSLFSIINLVMPDEIYNLAAQSHVGISFQNPIMTFDINALGVIRILDIIKELKNKKNIKIYQASTSELFGNSKKIPQNELTSFNPRSPYGISKLSSYFTITNYRESYGLHASNGILFNHESPRKGIQFVTRKITKAVAEIKAGKKKSIKLGNLEAKRDWGHAKDYVLAMWKIVQQENPDDYVIATGETHSVKEFVELSFSVIGKNIYWEGSKDTTKGVDSSGNILVEVDPTFYRPSEVNILKGDFSKAKKVLKWKPKISFKTLVTDMVKNDIRRLKP